MQSSRWAPQNTDEDGFAQTREPDNFFDDDITPVSAPIIQSIPPAVRPQRHPNQQGRARGNNRGSGRGRGGGYQETPRRQNSSTPQNEESKKVEDNAVVTPSQEPNDQTTEDPTDTKLQESESTGDAAGDASASAGGPKVQAVRGPRHQTGGLQRPKLTADELSARMAAAALNNAKREAAHREAEADAAKFEEREAEAKQRRVQETALRRVMDTEREKNRRRKLGAQGVREWDHDKDDSKFTAPPTRARSQPGVQGGVVRAQRGSENSEVFDNNKNDDGNFRGRGRGRGGRGGTGRGRGGRGDFSNGPTGASRNAPALGEDQFPALATNTKASPGAEISSASLISPINDKGTWAEQVEASQ